jgi:hypothetical protein
MSSWNFMKAIDEMGPANFRIWERVRKGTPFKDQCTPRGAMYRAARGDEAARAIVEQYKAELVKARLKS